MLNHYIELQCKSPPQNKKVSVKKLFSYQGTSENKMKHT